MTAPVSNQFGTTSALTIGTETTLGSAVTSAATLQGLIDVSNLANGSTPDILEIRVYGKVLTGSSEKLIDLWTLTGAQVEQIKYTPIYGVLFDWKITLKQTQGTGRTFDWNYVQFA